MTTNAQGNIPEIAKFEKVSLETWLKTFEDAAKEGGKLSKEEYDSFTKMYDEIKLPERATSGSAGYDIFLPLDIPPVFPGYSLPVPTGLKCKIAPGWVMLIAPKSGLGMRYKMRLDNTIGVIDSDYYNCESNEGHIIVSFSNELPPVTVTNPITQKPEIPKELILQIPRGKAFVQALFVPFGIVEGDNNKGIRMGGFGSTNA